MEPKEIEKKPIAPQNLEGLFAKKEVTLPHSVSKYISRLKAEGRLDEAKLVAQQVRERKEQTRQKKAQDELNRTIKRILETDDSEIQAVQEVRAIWLLDAAGVILPEERKNELIEALDSKTPKLRAAFEAQLSQIRDEMVKDYMPPWKPPQTRTRFHR